MKENSQKSHLILSQWIEDIQESQTIAMAKKARQLKAEGKDIINCTLGETDFNTPDEIKESLHRAIDDNYSFYTPVNGIAEVREAVCNKFKRDQNLRYIPDQIVLSSGAKQCLAQLFMVLLNPGDEVLLPAPYWVSYKQMIEMAGGVAVELKTKATNQYKIHPEQLQAAISSKTRAFIFSSPCNPSGSVYSKEQLEQLASVLGKHKEIAIISDEIYEMIIHDGAHHSIAQFANVFNQTIIINGLSKGFAMTGYRLGYMAAPTHIASAVTKAQSQITSATNAVTQMAAKTALEIAPASLSYMADSFTERRDKAMEIMKTIPGLVLLPPEGAFYLFPDISAHFGKSFRGKIIPDAFTFCMTLLEEYGLATVHGDPFGSPECMRLSFALSSEKMREGALRLKQFVEELV